MSGSISYKIINALSIVFLLALLVIPIFIVGGDFFTQALLEINGGGTVAAQPTDIPDSNDNAPVFETSTLPAPTQGPEYFSISDHNARLVIPAIKVDGQVFAGSGESTMNKGFWHYPTSAASYMYGNTTIIGHRYFRLPPRTDTFYNLDKIEIGDNITITTDAGDILYEVIQKQVVGVHDTWVLNHGNEPQLTLITCHPLWTSKERLVIISKLVRSTVKL